MSEQTPDEIRTEDGTVLLLGRDVRRSNRNAVFHRINAEKTKLEMLENMAHEFFPIGHDGEEPFTSQAINNLFDLLGMKI